MQDWLKCIFAYMHWICI